MNRTAVSALVLAMLMAPAAACLAAQELGPPEPYARHRGGALALGYAYYSSEWERMSALSETFDIDMYFIFVEGAYGFAPGWEAYTHLGAAKPEIRGEGTMESVGDYTAEIVFDGSYKFYFSLGLRGVLAESEHGWGFGPVFQYNYYSDYDDTMIFEDVPSLGDVDVKATYKDAYDVNIGVAALYDSHLGPVYFGIFGYWARGRARFEFTGLGYGPVTYDFEEKRNAGAYAGWRLPFGDGGWHLNLEGMYKSGPSFAVSFNRVFGV